MGRNRIKIERIENDRTRMSTFNKRKNGLLKKAMELSILCDCEVALIVISPNSKKITHYARDNMETVLEHYRSGTFEETPEVLHNSDYDKLFKNKPASKRARFSPDPTRPHSVSPVSFGRTTAVSPIPQLNGNSRSIPMPGGGMMTVSKFPVQPATTMRYVAPRSISPNPATASQSFSAMTSPIPGHVSPPNFFAVPPAAAIRPGAVRPNTPQFYGMPSCAPVATPSALMTPTGTLAEQMDTSSNPSSSSHFSPRQQMQAYNPNSQSTAFIQQSQQGTSVQSMIFKKNQAQVLEYSQSLNKKNLSLDIPDAHTTVTDAPQSTSFEDIAKLSTPSLSALGLPSAVTASQFLAMTQNAQTPADASSTSSSTTTTTSDQGVLPSPSSFFNTAGPLGPLGPDATSPSSNGTTTAGSTSTSPATPNTPNTEFSSIPTPNLASGAWTPNLSSTWYNAPKTPNFTPSTSISTPTFTTGSTGLTGSAPTFYASSNFMSPPTQTSEGGTKRKLSEMKA